MSAVAVVVPTVDRVTLLARCLRGIAAQERTPDEVLVVHDGNHAIVALLEEWSRRLPLRPVQVTTPGASDKRNAGWRAATAELVAFTDDDCEPTSGWLAGLASAADGASVVAGPVAPHPDDAAVTGLWARTVRSSEPGLYPGCNLAFRRTTLERIGGFDPSLTAGEDTDLVWRADENGAAIAWADDALVWHAVRSASLVQHLRSLPRWSTLPEVVRRHPQLRVRFAHKRWFWKESHPAACLAVVSLVAATVDRRAVVGIVPLLVRRVRRGGIRAGLALAANDVAEVCVLVVGSLRHKAVLL